MEPSGRKPTAARTTEIVCVWSLALIKFGLPFWLVAGLPWELHRDEYLYYAQGQHPAWGYLECPPLVAWLAHTASRMGGNFFWVKWWPGVFGAALVLVTAAIARELGGRWFAQLLAALGILFSACLRTNFLLQPVFLEIFFWTLSVYYLLRLIRSGQPVYYYILALSLTACWYSKYSALFLIGGLLPGLLLTTHRQLLVRKHLWLAAGLAILLILPNIYWQYRHNWPLAHHMQELRDTQLQYIRKTDFLKEQLLLLLPVSFVWIGGWLWLLFHKKFRILAFIYLGVIGLLVAGNGKGYYALGIYPMLLAAGGVCFEQQTIGKTRMRWAMVLLILAAAYPFLYLLLPVESPEAMARTNRRYDLAGKGLTRWEDQQNHLLQQDFADMIGWKELAGKAEQCYDSLVATGYQEVWVYCSNYGQAGALQYYARQHGFRQRVISRNGSFLLWIPRDFHFRHLLLIDDEWPGREEAVFRHFAKVALLDSVGNPFSRQVGDKIFLLQEADSVAIQLVQQEIAAKQRMFSRP